MEGRTHLKRSMEVIVMQREAGRYYLHEHPWSASSWREPEAQEVLAHPQNILIRTDFGQFNLRVAKGED
eukprot:12548301-Alexandrium_andersonii.AAC.1